LNEKGRLLYGVMVCLAEGIDQCAVGATTRSVMVG